MDTHLQRTENVSDSFPALNSQPKGFTRMKTFTLTAPSHWASAIMNRNYSGLSKEETSQLNTFLAINSVSFSDCLHCEDAGFKRYHDATAQGVLAADCQTYVFKAERK